MFINQKYYLQEMGISTWELIHPEKILGYQASRLDLPRSCKLLLVSPICPEGQTALMFERVLKSIKLCLDDALHLEPQQLSQLGTHDLDWIWFAGDEASDNDYEAINNSKVKRLHSPLLQDIDGNTEQRRALWLQICSYS